MHLSMPDLAYASFAAYVEDKRYDYNVELTMTCRRWLRSMEAYEEHKMFWEAPSEVLRSQQQDLCRRSEVRAFDLEDVWKLAQRDNRSCPLHTSTSR